MAWFSLLAASLTTDIIQVAAPSSGDVVTSNGTTTLLILNHGVLLATATVMFPSTPTDGARFVVASVSPITLMTLSADKPIKGTLASFAAGGYARFVYSNAIGAWVRTG